jgi:outer membrane protein assembly factor BamE (lipoprotein component of BamABCDE complex)
LAIEIANSLGAPRAAGFNVEDWFYVFTHSIKLSIERAHDNVKA